MAEGPSETPANPFHRAFAFTHIFRTFQVALDPRKLLVAAVGILAMSLGWHLLSRAVYSGYDKPELANEKYSATAMKRELGDKKPDGKSEYTADDYVREGKERHDRDLAEWKVVHDLAGPNGRLRAWPWDEYRGPNPFDLLSRLVGGTAPDIQEAGREFTTGTVPVLVEPLLKLFLPVIKLLDPHADFWTRLYLLACLLWSIVVWAFCGGVITRIAAVQFAGKERVTLAQAVRFVAARYTSYVLSPLVPLAVIAVIVLLLALYGLVAMIPVVGDFLLYGLGLPLVLIGGVAIAVLLVGLVGYPLMYATVSAEGSDTFDALSRSYNYVFQAPWHYLWYSVVSILYGAVLTLFVVFMASLAVYATKWALGQFTFANRSPDTLFLYAPESFGWRELLVRGSPFEEEKKLVTDPDTGRSHWTYPPKDPVAAEAYRKDHLWWIERAAAWMAAFWLAALLLLVVGFSYSYFWSASTMIYLLMRKKVDDTELDEVYVEEEQPEATYTPPATAPATPPAPTSPSSPGALSLPTTTAPASPPTPPAPPVPPPTTTVTPVPLPPPGGSVTIGPSPPAPASPPAATGDEMTADDEPKAP